MKNPKELPLFIYEPRKQRAFPHRLINCRGLSE